VTATSRPPPFYPFPNIPDYFPTTTSTTTTLLPTSTTTQLPSTSTTATATTTTSPVAASSRPPPTTFYPDPILPLRPVGEESSSGAIDLSTTSTTTATTTTRTTTTTSTSEPTTTSFPLSGKVEVFMAQCALGFLFIYFRNSRGEDSKDCVKICILLNNFARNSPYKKKTREGWLHVHVFLGTNCKLGSLNCSFFCFSIKILELLTKNTSSLTMHTIADKITIHPLQVLFSYGQEKEHIGVTTSELLLVHIKIKLFICLIFNIVIFRRGLR
jgi:hypothetical protein